jgi:hypothetical protein
MNSKESEPPYTVLGMYEKDINTHSTVIPYRGWLPGMSMIKIEDSLDSRNYPFKVISEDGNSCTWKLNFYNVFTIDNEDLTGSIGDFRQGGSIQSKKIGDVIGWDFKGWGGNSIFSSGSNEEVAELVKQDMIDYINKKLAI